jgi:multidrug efflux pump subunit AcrB
MPVAAIVSFVVVFALILMAVSVGLKFFDSRRKKQMAGMLQTASGEPVMAISNLLKEIDTDKPGGAKELLKSLHFSRHAQEQIQQAGLSWPPWACCSFRAWAWAP